MLKFGQLAIVAILSFFLEAATACKPSTVSKIAQSSTDPSNTDASKWPLLKPLMKSQGHLRVFIEPNLPEHATKVAYVVSTWSNALQRVSNWPIQKNIEIFQVSKWENSDIIFEFYKTSNEVLRKYPEGGSSVFFDLSARHGGKPLIVIADEDVREEIKLGVPAPDKNILLHEFGHALGLGDTYEIEGYQENIGRHRRSVMRSRAGFRFGELAETPSSDDLAGLYAILNKLQTGTFACPSGYIEHKGNQEAKSLELLRPIPRSRS